MRSIDVIVNTLGVDKAKYCRIIQKNRIPLKEENGMLWMENSDADLALELYYKEYEPGKLRKEQTQPGNNAQPQQARYAQYAYPTYPQEELIPDKYQPISAWGYVGYSLLFNIPILGLLMLLLYACSDDNINLRNYARAWFCRLLVVLCIALYIFFISI